MRNLFPRIFAFINDMLRAEIYFNRSLSQVPGNSIVFFPYSATLLACGLVGVVSYKKPERPHKKPEISVLEEKIKLVWKKRLEVCLGQEPDSNTGIDVEKDCFGGDALIESISDDVCELKKDALFFEVFVNENVQTGINRLTGKLTGLVEEEEKFLFERMGTLPASTVEVISKRIEAIKDIAWRLSKEISENVKKVKGLIATKAFPSESKIKIFKKINAVLNSIDRLEVRGRDSAGISLLFVLEKDEYLRFTETLSNISWSSDSENTTPDSDNETLLDEFTQRIQKEVLSDLCISVNEIDGPTPQVAISIAYKIAAEIGRLGDNVVFIRSRIRQDAILQTLSLFSHMRHTVSAHTRWASVGSIKEANCHPIDNRAVSGHKPAGIIHVCLNGDIDNYLDLKKEFEENNGKVDTNITTDTKIIPLLIESSINEGLNPEDAFRAAVNSFEGSHAISMHTDLAPGKLFLAQKGSGQAIFIGLADDHYITASEIYGFVEETSSYLKLDGEVIAQGKNGDTQGQIFVLDQAKDGGLSDISAMYYDGTPINLTEDDIIHTEITSRDIDRQAFNHYFLKEISEAPDSVEKTLLNRWKVSGNDEQPYVALDENTVPETIKTGLASGSIKRIFFVGQGTAGIAALACADILSYYLNDPDLIINALKASELSGFRLMEDDADDYMSDSLVIAITQSGTTTDTNRTVDMVRERGAHTMAIVNRRDSHITFKVDGVMYTSSGRDVEMSVASTKAFYSQIIAGALLGLFFAQTLNKRSKGFIAEELNALLEVPDHMRQVLTQKDSIQESADKLALSKTYWAAVGSGPNKASADEIRIKLSELCYKTISTDYVEDKKHIDLSSEPLIIVCAAGTRSNVIGDIIKDTAIFTAHKATPVIITDEGEDRFDMYSDHIFHIPHVREHLAPVLSTLVGHLWGYYAALSINEASSFLHNFREDLKITMDEYTDAGLDIFELILEKRFREKIAQFYAEFRRRSSRQRFLSASGFEGASDLTLLLKYLTGSLPVLEFEIDFGVKGTALNMINELFKCLGSAINALARPIDAIKHQAKTVTVGTSRISEKLEGMIFDNLDTHGFGISHLTPSNILVLKNFQKIIQKIKGAVLYKISGLSVLGEATENTRIEVVRKDGSSAVIPSRAEKENLLIGTKRIIVRQGNVYIGKGRKDGRSILAIPLVSASKTAGSVIEHILLYNITLRDEVLLNDKIKALGGKFEHIKNIVQENTITWQDDFIDLVDMQELFGKSAEKIAELLVAMVGK